MSRQMLTVMAVSPCLIARRPRSRSGRGVVCGGQRARPHEVVLRPAVSVSRDVYVSLFLFCCACCNASLTCVRPCARSSWLAYGHDARLPHSDATFFQVRRASLHALGLALYSPNPRSAVSFASRSRTTCSCVTNLSRTAPSYTPLFATGTSAALLVSCDAATLTLAAGVLPRLTSVPSLMWTRKSEAHTAA